VRHDLRPGDAPPGPAGQKAVAEKFRATFPDVRLELEALVAEGDLVAARWTIFGTHQGVWGDVAPTGRNVRFSGVNFFRIADNRIAEIWNIRDDLGLWEQVGAAVYAGYPEPTDR
jgi:predicted ester cyclase